MAARFWTQTAHHVVIETAVHFESAKVVWKSRLNNARNYSFNSSQSLFLSHFSKRFLQQQVTTGAAGLSTVLTHKFLQGNTSTSFNWHSACKESVVHAQGSCRPCKCTAFCCCSNATPSPSLPLAAPLKSMTVGTLGYVPCEHGYGTFLTMHSLTYGQDSRVKSVRQSYSPITACCELNLSPCSMQTCRHIVVGYAARVTIQTGSLSLLPAGHILVCSFWLAECQPNLSACMVATSVEDSQCFLMPHNDAVCGAPVFLAIHCNSRIHNRQHSLCS